MRRFIGVAVVLAAMAMTAWAMTAQRVRLSAQSQVTAYRTYHLIHAAADTFTVDTVYSETLDMGDYKYLHYKLGVDGFTCGDSANDSIEVIFHTMGYNTNAPWFDTLLSADTPNMADGATDSTTYLRDSLVLTYTAFDKVYWRMIISDSVIDSNTVTVDTTDVRIRIEVVQSEVVDR